MALSVCQKPRGYNVGVLALYRAACCYSGVGHRVVERRAQLLVRGCGDAILQYPGCTWKQQFGLRGFANTAEDVGCATSVSVVAEPWLRDPATEAPTAPSCLIGMIVDPENQVAVDATGGLMTTVPVSDDANHLRNLADLKGLIKLNVFEASSQAEWTIFKEDFINVMALVSEGADVLLDRVAALSDSDIEVMELEYPAKSKIVYALLRGACGIIPRAKMAGVPRGNGFAAWSQILKEFEPRGAAGRLKEITRLLDPQWAQQDFLAEWRLWEKQVAEFECRYHATLPSDIKCAVVAKNLPAKVKYNLRAMDTAALESYE